MAEGAVGLSTGLSYFPGSYADTEELVRLCETVAACGGVYVTHLRSVFRGASFDPVEEALEIARRSGIALHFSHFRTRPTNAGHVTELLRSIDAAEADGIDISLECYPYPSGSTTALMFLPPWAHEGGMTEILARLMDTHERQRIIAAMPAPIQGADGTWRSIVVSHLGAKADRSLVGRSIEQIAEQRGLSPEDALCSLLLEAELEVGFWGTPPEDDVWQTIDRDFMQLFARPNYMLGSDSISVGDKPHPRGYGAFPRLLGRLRRRFGTPPLETLVNRLAAVPAERFGLRDRGVVRRGMAADIAIFDAEKLSDTATYDEPRRLAVGMIHVLVNGVLALSDGRPTGVLAGRALP
jgi:N-acyl-D-amino-acid deacylase